MQRASSRELSSRVDIDVHRQPNRVRRRTWWLAFWAAIGSLGWVFWEHSRGENQIYQAGNVTNPHRLIENECWRCHTQWTPLKRLVSFDLFEDEYSLHSIDNEKCLFCHQTLEHHDNQKPGHPTFSCAYCHQEHEGAEMLTTPHDRHCTFCHENLKEHTDLAKHNDSDVIFDNHVTRFDLSGGHPEFRLFDLLKSSGSGAKAATPHDRHGVKTALSEFQRPLAYRSAKSGDDAPKWQDRGRIYFNHSVHLKPGLPDENRKLMDEPMKCDRCHEPDDDRRFFKPINYENHCRRCHPLLFDHFNLPGQSVPHQTPELVRGYLAEQYTLRVLSDPKFKPELERPDDPPRSIPGHRDFQRKLTKAQAEAVRDEVARAETTVRDGVANAEMLAQLRQDRLLGPEATGGCRYCHEVESANPMPPATLTDWKIVPTQIPSRWLQHGLFHHEPHRLLSCVACHDGVNDSKSTGDVLIPSIDLCRACHSASPREWAKKLTAKGLGTDQKTTESLNELLSNVNRGAGAHCIECHVYHDPHEVKWNGKFVPKSKE